MCVCVYERYKRTGRELERKVETLFFSVSLFSSLIFCTAVLYMYGGMNLCYVGESRLNLPT